MSIQYTWRSILVVSPVHKFSDSLVPNVPPDNVQAITSSSTAVLVTWDPVPEIDRNGIITQYEVEFNQSTFNEISTSNLTTTDGSQLMVEVEGLEEYVEYTVRVRAFTSVGPGPFSGAMVNRTLEDGEIRFCINHVQYHKQILLDCIYCADYRYNSSLTDSFVLQ